MHALHTTIIAESKKPINAGERRKRLRTLVETLASWWLAGGGTSVAPYSRPIDVMVIAQSFMDGPESFWDLRSPYSVWMLSKDRRSRRL
jgi:hypothetical protein